VLETLDRDECLTLLASEPVGRIGITDRAMPSILPVNYLLDGSDVIIRSTAGSKLAAATREAVVAFETDSFDPAKQSGWSVLVVGVAHHVTNSTEIDRLSRLGLRPYIDGAASNFIRIRTAQITGRRLRPTPSPP
jgi:uncharacterized protein